MGVDQSQSFERFREGTDLIIKAWTADKPFSFRGKFWQLEDYVVLSHSGAKASPANLRFRNDESRELPLRRRP
jgi:alkanesulfonate monooxygenase SsuD/methylene tetrahydromethanopterin reductase-like flavin-dependent oxidoreductase (luciferase family)